MDIALYTTIHPGTRPFLKEWYESVRAQTDSAFDLWIGIDELTVGEACTIIEEEPEARWVEAKDNDTPAQVRERAWWALIPKTDAVVMVDADDVMHPERVEAARQQIKHHDGGGCALRLIGEKGESLDHRMPPESFSSAERALPKYNIFGLTNSTYRTDVLESSLPIPSDVILVDWYIATMAWLRGDDLAFDRSVRMDYRQHEDSTLSVLPPFTPEDIRIATDVVQNHFKRVLQNLPSEPISDRLEVLRRAWKRINSFADQISDVQWLRSYTRHLNQIAPTPLWWACVAHPSLDSLWKKTISVE
jgi:hypothetical protein